MENNEEFEEEKIYGNRYDTNFTLEQCIQNDKNTPKDSKSYLIKINTVENLATQIMNNPDSSNAELELLINYNNFTRAIVCDPEYTKIIDNKEFTIYNILCGRYSKDKIYALALLNSIFELRDIIEQEHENDETTNIVIVMNKKYKDNIIVILFKLLFFSFDSSITENKLNKLYINCYNK